jgi:hypothetical protein
MEVHFTPEQEAQLARIATSAGIAAEEIVRHAALRLLEEDTAAPGSVVAEMRALRERLGPDPEGWTTRDYVLHGRRLMPLVVDASVSLGVGCAPGYSPACNCR